MLKMKIALAAVALLAALAVSATAQCVESVVTETVSDKTLYTTDGQPGITVQAFVSYETQPDGSISLCELGVRFPHPSRVTHELPNGGGPVPGAPINIDFAYPQGATNVQKRFKSLGFGVNQAGHPNGNYKEYREANLGPKPETWSWLTQHVDAHFFFLSSQEVDAITGWVPPNPPPPEIAAKCACEPEFAFAASAGHYSEQDCIPGMGRHWAEDKLEPIEVFRFQPALIFGTYDCKPAFWEPMVATEVLDWVDANAPENMNGIRQANIAWPQPEKYYKRGYYPHQYSIRRAADDKKIGGGATFEITMRDFLFHKKGQPNLNKRNNRN